MWSQQQHTTDHMRQVGGPRELQPPRLRATKNQTLMAASQNQRSLLFPRQKTSLYLMPLSFFLVQVLFNHFWNTAKQITVVLIVYAHDDETRFVLIRFLSSMSLWITKYCGPAHTSYNIVMNGRYYSFKSQIPVNACPEHSYLTKYEGSKIGLGKFHISSTWAISDGIHSMPFGAHIVDHVLCKMSI